jgi:hypothetical protein
MGAYGGGSGRAAATQARPGRYLSLGGSGNGKKSDPEHWESDSIQIKVHD